MAVQEGGQETLAPETVGLVCNVAIVQHEGVLQTRWERRLFTLALEWLFFCSDGSVLKQGSASTYLPASA